MTHYAIRNFWRAQKPVYIGDPVTGLPARQVKLLLHQGKISETKPETKPKAGEAATPAATDPAGNGADEKTPKEIAFARAEELGFEGEYGKTTQAKLEQFITEAEAAE